MFDDDPFKDEFSVNAGDVFGGGPKPIVSPVPTASLATTGHFGGTATAPSAAASALSTSGGGGVFDDFPVFPDGLLPQGTSATTAPTGGSNKASPTLAAGQAGSLTGSAGNFVISSPTTSGNGHLGDAASQAKAGSLGGGSEVEALLRELVASSKRQEALLERLVANMSSSEQSGHVGQSRGQLVQPPRHQLPPGYPNQIKGGMMPAPQHTMPPMPGGAGMAYNNPGAPQQSPALQQAASDEQRRRRLEEERRKAEEMRFRKLEEERKKREMEEARKAEEMRRLEEERRKREQLEKKTQNLMQGLLGGGGDPTTAGAAPADATAPAAGGVPVLAPSAGATPNIGGGVKGIFEDDDDIFGAGSMLGGSGTRPAKGGLFDD
ncbi:unnamed protein product [Amoebophrya sp. A25]|nr:unnamed protein product [Amoebophrya sp. A25]|eukprot:GSA25T00018048001.1